MSSGNYSLISIAPTKFKREYHEMEVNEIFEQFKLNPNKGLNNDQIKISRNKYGLNHITQQTQNRAPFCNIYICCCFVSPILLCILIGLLLGVVLLIVFGSSLSILFVIYIRIYLQMNQNQTTSPSYNTIVIRDDIKKKSLIQAYWRKNTVKNEI